MGTQSKRNRRAGNVIPSAANSPSEDRLRQAMEAAEAQQRDIKATFGRTPIQLGDVLKLTHDAKWPQHVVVNPLDFFFLAMQGPVVHKDNDGPYFYLSSTKVRPAPGANEVLDLSEWEPNRVTLAAFGE